MKQWSWEILPCQDDRQVLEWSKKVIIPKKSKTGLNITHDASHDAALPSSLLILRENIDRKKKKKITQRQQSKQQLGLLLIFI